MRLFLMGLLGSVALAALALPVHANDRMAGGQGKAKAPAAAHAPAPKKTAEQPAEKPAPSPTVQKFSYKVLESYGALDNPMDGSLGIDMWDGSQRSVIVENIPHLPAGSTERTLQQMTLRLLLTRADSEFLRKDVQAEAGNDLLTLRLEKLLEIGAYQHAMDLYTQIAGEPYHERLARAGIMAMMHSGHAGQACLEFRAVEKRLAPTAGGNAQWWAGMSPVCHAIQHRMGKASEARAIKASAPADGNRPDADAPDQTDTGSKVLDQFMSRPNYRYTISDADDFAALNPLERAVLSGARRFDYSRLKMNKIDTMDGPFMMIMVTDPNLPTRYRQVLTAEAVRRGLMDVDALVAVYNDETITDGPLAGVAAKYRALPKTSKDALTPMLSGLMDFKSRAMTAAYFPFADALADADPAAFDGRAMTNAMRVMMLAGNTPSEGWIKAWAEHESVRESLTPESLELGAAIVISERNPPSSEIFDPAALTPLLNPPESQKAAEILAVFSGLGQEDVLHNIVEPAVYEKLFDLTLVNDYVMPSGGLVEQLGKAAQDQRLGEVALLASVVLNDMSRAPDKVHPGVLREVLRSLKTVGFKKEAHALARGVIVGLGE